MKKKAVEYSLTCEKKDFPIIKVRNSLDAIEFARKFYHEDINIYESTFIMLLNHANNVIGYAKISQGGISNALVDIRIVCKYAIESLAAGVIFVHNHPTGIMQPSSHDIKLSERLRDALKILDIKFLDSIILSDSDSFSMRDEDSLRF